MCKNVLLLLITVVACNGYNILGLFPAPGRSHFNIFGKLMKSLADRGHEVDVLSHFPQKTPIPRYNDLSVLGTFSIPVNNLTVASMADKTTLDMFNIMLGHFGTDVCEVVLHSQVAKDLINTSKRYDLIITEIFGSDCLLGFAHLFKVPVIAIIGSVDLPWGGYRIGNPDNPSYIPNYFLPHITPMSLTERYINTFALVAAKLGYEWISIEKSNKIYKNFFGSNGPHLTELIQQIDLILVNSHFSINSVRPTLPNFVEVGGLHIEDPKPLPKDLDEILNLNHNGTIYFSMGSMILAESFSVDIIRALFEAFRKLPYTVLWKGNEKNVPKSLAIPSNIYFKAWTPQIDVLCHPNLKLFVSHGGLLGTQEAVYCAVPRLGIPLFADQELNVRNSENMGLAIRVPYNNITEESIFEAVNELLTNPKYKANCENISKLFRDRPLSPLETAIYWVEYVIRHKGTKHMRSVGADLPWHQYFLVDVILISLLMVFIIAMLFYYFIKCVLHFVLPNKLKVKRS